MPFYLNKYTGGDIGITVKCDDPACRCRLMKAAERRRRLKNLQRANRQGRQANGKRMLQSKRKRVLYTRVHGRGH